MHYRNGREAKNGDTILFLCAWPKPVVGVLANAVAGNDFCNGNLYGVQDTYTPNLAECLHIDDVIAAVNADSRCAKPCTSSS